jgi:hypothetical protein
VSLFSSLVEASREFGISLIDSTLEADGLVARDTAATQSVGLGVGISVQGKSSAAVSRSVVSRNATAGILVASYGTTASIEYSVIEDTSKDWPLDGETGGGDGIVVLDHAELDLRSCLLGHNFRSGAFFDHSGGTVATTSMVGNGWALVSQKSAVDWENKNNDLSCNAHPGKSNPGLPVPPPPDLPAPMTSPEE